MPLNLTTGKAGLIRPTWGFLWQTHVICGRHGFLSATAARWPARASTAARPRAACGIGRGQANRTTESTTSAPPEASQRPDDTITDPGSATVYSCRLPRTVRPHRTTSTLSITRDAPITGPRHSLGLIPGLVSLLAALANIGDDPRWPLTGLFAGIRASTTTQAAHRNSRRSIGFISGAQQTPQQQTLTRQHNPRRKPRRIRPTKEQNSQTTRTVTTVS